MTTVPIGGLRVSRFILGSNPFSGFSHQSPEMSRRMEHYYTAARIKEVRDFWAGEEYARELGKVYAATGLETQEVVYFVEQVTGHTIADFRPAMTRGLKPLIDEARNKAESATGAEKDFYQAAAIAMAAVMHLAERYAARARQMADREEDHTSPHKIAMSYVPDNLDPPYEVDGGFPALRKKRRNR